MGRKPRKRVAGGTMHVWQRGNHQEAVFLNDAGNRMFLSILMDYCSRYSVQISGFCLMSNHYHLVATGPREDSISRAVGHTNREYSAFLHKGAGTTGQLWQGRFGSVLLDEAHFWAALCYVERNPVMAGLVTNAWDWPWSSARAHLGLATEPMLDFGRWQGRYGAQTWREALVKGIFDSALEERIASGKSWYHGTQEKAEGLGD